MNGMAFPKCRQNDIVVQKLNDEVLIYDLGNHKAFCLNDTSSLVWQMCDGNNSVDDISKQLSKKLKTSVSEDLVWLAIDQLKKDNLLENSQEIEPKFSGLSRREVIRKVGLASVVALPLISSLVAPKAAAAQSMAAVCGSPGLACACTGTAAGPTTCPCSAANCTCNATCVQIVPGAFACNGTCS